MSDPGGSGPTFVLIHGGLHGAWCWDRLVPELEAGGSRALAVDLPIEDPSLGAGAYASEVLHAAADLEGPVVLVAHSMGGLVMPLVASQRPTALMVFLCAVLPDPGRSVAEQYAQDPGAVGEAPEYLIVDDLGRHVADPITSSELFYPDCSPEDRAWAQSRLRPQSTKVVTETTPLETWPECPARYILARDDRAVPPDWARRAARERLGVDPIELGGGHSPFLSRPGELAEILMSLAGSVDLPSTDSRR